MQALTTASAYGSLAHGSARLFRGRQVLNALILALGDLLGLGAALVLAGWLPNGDAGSAARLGWIGFTLITWLVGAWVLQLLPSWGLGAPTEIKRATELTVLVFMGTAVAMLLTGHASAIRPSSLLLGLVLAWPLALLARFAAKSLLVKARLWGLPTVVYGGGQAGAMLIAALKENPGYGYTPVAVLDDAPGLQGLTVHGVPVVGLTSEVVPGAPVAVLAMPGAGRARMVELLEGPLAGYRSVVIVPDLFDIESLWVKASDFGGVLGLEVTRAVLDPAARAFKRAFDLAAVLLSAPLWVPLCLLVALFIWLEDRAPVLFVQSRVGLDGRLFETLKFRTMVPNAEAVLRDTLARDPILRAEWDANHKLRRDPRITRVGVWLRRMSIDELPQLINVLLGSMSLVGPRPLPPYHQAHLSTQVQRLRERVRPGLTGLWQVSGRSASGDAGMERWDPYYVRNWSPWLDLVILIRTLRAVVLGSGAY